MYKVLILLGGNYPETPELFKKAEEMIAASFGTICKNSSVYESRAWGFDSERNFLNAVIEVETPLTPEEQIAMLLKIEAYLGRKREKTDVYSSRGIDLDILFIDDLILETTQLEVPHPRLHLRRFTLVPLCEHWGEKIHPKSMKTLNTLLQECSDEGVVGKTSHNFAPKAKSPASPNPGTM